MTAKDVINYSAKLANIMASGETLNDDEYTDCLAQLNAMLARWNVEQVAIYSIVTYSHALSAGTASYTIGSAGTFNTARPTKIVAANVAQSNGIAIPLEIIDIQKWNALIEPGIAGVQPRQLYCDYAYPLATIYLSPKPSGTPTLNLWVWQQFSGFANLTDTFDFPPGYLEAVWTNLAIHLAVMFGKQISPGLAQDAQASKGAIASLNVSDQTGNPSALPQPQQQQ